MKFSTKLMLHHWKVSAWVFHKKTNLGEGDHDVSESDHFEQTQVNLEETYHHPITDPVSFTMKYLSIKLVFIGLSILVNPSL